MDRNKLNTQGAEVLQRVHEMEQAAGSGRSDGIDLAPAGMWQAYGRAQADARVQPPTPASNVSV